MSEVTGHVRKRSRNQAKPWQIVIEMGNDPATGKRRRKVQSGFATKKEATAAMRRMLIEMEDQIYVDPSKLTVGQYLTDQWLPAHRREIRPNTLSNYRTQISAYVLPHIGAVPLQDLTTPQVSSLYAILEERGGKNDGPLSPKTVRNVHLLLHRAFKDAVAWDLRKTNPTEGSKPPTAKRATAPASKMVTWTPSQISRFIDSVADDRLFALWRVVFFTGMRRSEVLGVRWADVSFARETIAVVQTLVEVDGIPQFSEPKTARSRRVIHLDRQTVDTLKRHRLHQLEERMAWADAYQDLDLVFAREDGSPIRPAYLSRHFDRLQSDLGLPSMGLHGARHSWATNALSAGVPLKVVSEQLGHSSIAITADTYQHVSDEMGAGAAQKVADLYR